jgi:site-specific DNA-methyltransferase (adenine-specific)
MINRIHNMPALEMFAGLTEQAALIVADPPYGIKYRSHRTRSRTVGIREYNGKSAIQRTRRAVELFDDAVVDTSWLIPAFNSLKDGGAMYLFTRWDVCHHWHKAAQQAGFKVVQRLVWDKAHWGTGDLRYYGSMTEDVLFCVKGLHSLRWDKRSGNIWRVPAQGGITQDLSKDGGYRHPTQKPVALFKKLIIYSSDPGDLVIDPFTGSGAACIAAQRLHRRFVGCDISPTFAQAAQAWVEQDAPHTLPMF